MRKLLFILALLSCITCFAQKKSTKRATIPESVTVSPLKQAKINILKSFPVACYVINTRLRVYDGVYFVSVTPDSVFFQDKYKNTIIRYRYTKKEGDGYANVKYLDIKQQTYITVDLTYFIPCIVRMSRGNNGDQTYPVDLEQTAIVMKELIKDRAELQAEIDSMK